MRSRWRSGAAVIAGTARALAPGGKGGSAAEPGQAAPRLEKCLLREIVGVRGVAAGDEFAVSHGRADGTRGGRRSLRPNKVANRAQSGRATPLKPGMAPR